LGENKPVQTTETVTEGEEKGGECPLPSDSISKPTNSQDEDPLKVRTDALNLQVKTSREILDKLFQSGRIDKLQYQKHMDLAIQIYDQEMTEIE
jgi:hypothetical protein